jgi:diguanylate cyclase (GGDEF)-like protein/PAS domain S-box-containing protein
MTLHNEFIDENLIKLFDATPVAMLLSLCDGSFEYVNPALLNMLGYTSEEIYQQGLTITHPDDIAESNLIRLQLQADPFTPVVLEKRYLHKSGAIITGIVTMVAQPSENGKIQRFIAQVVNISEQKRIENALQLFRTLVLHSNDSIFVIDPITSIILDANKQASDDLGYSNDELLKLQMTDIMECMQDQDSWQKYVADLRCSPKKIMEGQHIRKDGSIYPVETSISYIMQQDVDYIVSNVRDITERKKSQELIWQQANYDFLTSLPNRVMMLRKLHVSVQESLNNHKNIAVLCLDLDNFKDINDTLGHAYGDKLLIETAHRIKICISTTDTIARMGGDEFAIIMRYEDDTGNVERVTEQILQALSEPFYLGISKSYISVSIGITLCPNDATEVDTLLLQADQAMYAAKNHGKNQFHYFTKALQSGTEAKMWLSQELREALDKNQFQIVYQPVICLITGVFLRAEALLRWHHPDVGLISPQSFIAVAEENGLISKIGEWVFREVANQARHWRETIDPKFQVSINISPLQFKHIENGLRDWDNYLQQIGLPGEAIIVEITESTLMDVTTVVRETLLLHRALGIQLAIDDFGTGYSSLAYLKKFDIDYLKIDQSFVKNLTNNSDDIVLCEAIIMMAHKLSLRVIAEGVETKEQADMLAVAGCDYGQGYYYSPGIPSADFEALCRNSKLNEIRTN